MDSCGASFKGATNQDRYAYVRAPDRAWLPTLTDRRLCVRHAAHRGQVNAAMPHRLPVVSRHAADPVPVIATRALPVGGRTRAPRDRWFKIQADDGDWAAKARHDDGVKRGVRSAGRGMLSSCPRFPARPHASNARDDVVDGFAGIGPADNGCMDAVRQALLHARHGVRVGPPPRKGMAAAGHPQRVNVGKRIRNGVERVGSHLTERFAMARMRVHARWHGQQRLIRNILADTVVVFRKRHAGRPPLDLDGLVTV